jgi:hypothetical protein
MMLKRLFDVEDPVLSPCRNEQRVIFDFPRPKQLLMYVVFLVSIIGRV